MRKVVFKGVINGEEFDNVKDYNDKINELIAKGGQINASSDTHIADEPEPVEQKFDELGERMSKLTPYFEDDSDEHYLDKLVTGDDEIDKKRLEVVKTDLTDALKNLETVLKSGIDVMDALSIMNDYKNIRNSILEDQYTNNTLMNSLTEEIERDTDKLELLKNSAPFIKTLLDFYGRGFNELRNYILSNNRYND